MDGEIERTVLGLTGYEILMLPLCHSSSHSAMQLFKLTWYSSGLATGPCTLCMDSFKTNRKQREADYFFLNDECIWNKADFNWIIHWFHNYWLDSLVSLEKCFPCHSYVLPVISERESVFLCDSGGVSDSVRPQDLVNELLLSSRVPKLTWNEWIHWSAPTWHREKAKEGARGRYCSSWCCDTHTHTHTHTLPHPFPDSELPFLLLFQINELMVRRSAVCSPAIAHNPSATARLYVMKWTCEAHTQP